MTDEKAKIIEILTQARQIIFRWWSGCGIGFRASFFMIVALILLTALVAAFFFWEGKKAIDAEIRGRTLYIARELAFLTVDDIASKNRFAISKKFLRHLAMNAETLSTSPLLYLLAYDKNYNLLIGRTAGEVILRSGSFRYVLPAKNGSASDETVINHGFLPTDEPLFLAKENGAHDLTISVISKGEHVGFLRVGIYTRSHGQGFSNIMNRAGVALLGILLIGLAFSRIFALGITRPILRLNEAVDKLRYQNWDSPIPVHGTDEISKLGHAFNQMAMTLRERDTSLSRGNADLFLLHAAGLDLMECLDREALLPKIAARAEELVRAETTAISAVGRYDHVLKYLWVFGRKKQMIQEQDLPIESGGIYNWLASYGAPLLITDAQSDFRLDGNLMRSLGIKSVIAVPLWSSNIMTGLLSAINKQGSASFDKHDLRLFTVFSSLAAAALQNASLYSDLKEKMNELSSAQEQLVQSTKLAAIGELSANVAHEINNPLTSVLGYTTHLMKTLQLPEGPKRILGMMEQELLRVRKFIRNLLDFARHKPSLMQPADITQPLRETTALVRGIAEAAAVSIHEDYPLKPIIVKMDHNEMKQVFINIVSNALQVMPQGGDLRIRLDCMQNNEVVAEFSDTGTGIKAEDMDKIFKPFFSTKSSGDGAGLGLSISSRIVHNHGGRIEAESTTGKGAVFKVFLPLHLASQRGKSV